MISPDEASCASSGALSRDDVQRILVELSEARKHISFLLSFGFAKVIARLAPTQEVREFGCPGPTIERIPVPSALEFLVRWQRW